MYITIEAFTKCMYHYLQLAKIIDVYIEDATQGTVWVLHCQRTPPLAKLASSIQQSFRKQSNPTSAM